MKQTAVEWLVKKLSYETSDGTIISHHFIINKLVEQANGEQPKTFTFGNRRWILNKFNNYDWSDPITNQIYMRNVNLDTGISEAEPELDKPVDQELIQKNLENYIILVSP